MPNFLDFSDIYGQIQNFVQDTSAGTLTVIKAEINSEYMRLTEAIRWKELDKFLDGGTTLVAGEIFFALPGDAAYVHQISDATNDHTFINRSHAHIVRDNLETIDSSKTVLFFSELGIRPTNRPLSADSVITVLKETSGSELAVKVVGLRSDKEIRASESITTTGATPVVGSTEFREGWSLDTISIPSTSTEIFTAREGTTVIADIAVGEKASQYFIIHFDGSPASGVTLKVYYKVRAQELVNDADLPLVPGLGDVLVEAVKGKMRQYDRKYTQAAEHSGMARQIVTSMLSERNVQPERVRQAAVDLRGRGYRRAF